MERLHIQRYPPILTQEMGVDPGGSSGFHFVVNFCNQNTERSTPAALRLFE
jgi:hypothetical protein